jgi:type II secretory pathway predicted ATPase ExeA
MDYTIRNKDGFVVITGEVGAGKTTLIRKLLSEFDDNVLVAKIFQTQLDEAEFLQAVLVEFGLNPFNAKKVELMDMLSTFLIDSFLQNKQLVLIVDEAQNLRPRVLEEIRMLSGLETQKQKILHVIIVGQPELNQTLDSPALEQLRQRIRLRFHISALTEAETKDYIAHRLFIAAGENRHLFTDDAIPLIYQYSGGIPRLVNTLCDTAMMCAYVDDSPLVSIDNIKAAIEELQWVPYDQRKREAAPKETAENSSSGLLHEGRPIKVDQLDQLVTALEGIDAHMTNIEGLLKEALLLLQRRNRRISVRLGRAQLAQLMKQLSGEVEKTHVGLGPNGN